MATREIPETLVDAQASKPYNGRVPNDDSCVRPPPERARKVQRRLPIPAQPGVDTLVLLRLCRGRHVPAALA